MFFLFIFNDEFVACLFEVQRNLIIICLSDFTERNIKLASGLIQLD